MAGDAIQIEPSEISANSPSIDRPFCDSFELPFVCRPITARPPPLIGVNVVTGAIWRQLIAALVCRKRTALRSCMAVLSPPLRSGLTVPNMVAVFLRLPPPPVAAYIDRRLVASSLRHVSGTLPPVSQVRWLLRRPSNSVRL